MRLVMMGTGPFAVPTLRALVASEHEVPVVVSRPFRGRKGTPPPPMHEAAAELGLELWTPESANTPAAQARLAALAADLLVVCDYGEILKPATLATTRLGGINLHGSLLPKYRGAAPVQWAVLSGDAETGNTVIHMTPALDAGPCLAQQRTPIDPDETAGELEARLAAMGPLAVLEVIDQLTHGRTQPLPQDGKQASRAPRLCKDDGLIDWSQGSAEIKNRVRALQPWPRTFTFVPLSGKEPLRVTIDRVQLVLDPPAAAPPGSVQRIANRLLVGTGDGWLEVVTLQPAGKRQLTAAEFLNGYPQVVGLQLSRE